MIQSRGPSLTEILYTCLEIPRNLLEISEISGKKSLGNLCAHAQNPESSRNLAGNLHEIQKSLGISRNLIEILEIFWRNFLKNSILTRVITFAAVRNTNLSLLDSHHVSEEKANVLLGEELICVKTTEAACVSGELCRWKKKLDKSCI